MARRTSYQTTMKDVAALAGVSVQTVSFVINNNPVISPETRQRVQDAIAQLHYTPDASALCRVDEQGARCLYPEPR